MAVNTMKDIINHGAECYGDQDAFRYKVRKEIRSKSYRQLKADCEAFSRGLESLGLLGKHIAVIGATSYFWVTAYFGTANSGGVIVPLDAGLPAGDLCELINRADVSALVYDELRKDAAEAAAKKCPGLSCMISMQADHDRPAGEESPVPVLSFQKFLSDHEGSFDMELDPDKMCAILFTSGTTGISKGVMLSHRNLTDNAVCLDMKIPAGTVSMTLLPIHHAYCFTMDILKGLYIGITICINDSIMHVSRNMKLFKPEIVLLVPLVIKSIYAKLKDLPSLLPKHLVAKEAFGGRLKTICSGGAYLDPELIRQFAEYGITVLQGYGMTECSPVISTNLEWANKIGSVGKLLPNCQAKVVDEELWVRGSSVMLGYYKMPEETAATLTDGWLRTGDLGYVDEDNYIYITGRKKNLIILENGENVSPEELENLLYKDPLVKEALVRESGSVIEAEIFPDEEYAKKKKIRNMEEHLQALVNRVNEGQPPYKKIHSLKVRNTEFQKTSSKKIKRNQ